MQVISGVDFLFSRQSLIDNNSVNEAQTVNGGQRTTPQFKSPLAELHPKQPC